ncbi:MAG: hydroxymethylbilane synthase [Acidimicrobiales bacterium]
MRPLRVATRGSALALWQARHVATLIAARGGPEVELVITETSGDLRTDVPIHQIGGTGVFAKEVQAAVTGGLADVAVHSAKDLPSTPTPGLVIAAVPPRGDARDALVGCRLESLPFGAEVATGSVRRRAQLAALRPDLRFAELRGNIGTRLARAADHHAIVVAKAALDRLGETPTVVDPLAVADMVPQVGQGALAIECRTDDAEVVALLRAIEDESTRRAVDAERAFLATLGSGCDLPVGAHAVVSVHGAIVIDGLIAALDGATVVRGSSSGEEPVEVGRRLAERLLADGGRELLAAGDST